MAALEKATEGGVIVGSSLVSSAWPNGFWVHCRMLACATVISPRLVFRSTCELEQGDTNIICRLDLNPLHTCCPSAHDVLECVIEENES